MTERPILFSGAMVRALLAGTKTQTRRVVGGLSKRFPLVQLEDGARFDDPMAWGWKRAEDGVDAPLGGWLEWCPYGVASDRLWVRESFHAGTQNDGRKPSEIRPGASIWYEADRAQGHAQPGKLWPGIFMPRWACRLVLEVTGVRVERVQDISGYDAIAEGCERKAQFDPNGRTAVEKYRDLWDSLNAKRRLGWVVNPWVWVVEFRRCS